MGNVFSSFVTTKKILILGPRLSGKSKVFAQIINQYKIKTKVETENKVNFLKFKNFNVWDLSGHNDCVKFWSCYYDNSAGVIYLFDLQNENESEKMLKELIYQKELRNAAFLVIFNKMSPEEKTIESYFQNTKRLISKRLIQCVQIPENGDFTDVNKGFEWLLKACCKIKNK
jgi:small GTP-binding protein